MKRRGKRPLALLRWGPQGNGEARRTGPAGSGAPWDPEQAFPPPDGTPRRGAATAFRRSENAAPPRNGRRKRLRHFSALRNSRETGGLRRFRRHSAPTARRRYGMAPGKAAHGEDVKRKTPVLSAPCGTEGRCTRGAVTEAFTEASPGPTRPTVLRRRLRRSPVASVGR